MRQFELTEYNRLVSEGKTPKVVTRDGRPCRIVCTDVDNERYPIVGLIQKKHGESINSFTEIGQFAYASVYQSEHDLFFADPEPTYRPYKDAEEFLKAQKEHGSYLLACGQNLFPSLVDDKCIVTVSTSGAKAWTYSEVLDVFVWRDKSPCGVKEE